MEEIKLSDKAKSLKLGFYQHYKGGIYRVIGVAFHSETLEELVVYQPQYREMNYWVRPLSMFLENVEKDGQNVPRFRYLN